LVPEKFGQINYKIQCIFWAILPRLWAAVATSSRLRQALFGRKDSSFLPSHDESATGVLTLRDQARRAATLCVKTMPDSLVCLVAQC